MAADEEVSFFSFLTNCPPIEHLVLEVRNFSSTPTMFLFRCQEGAFYAEQLTVPDPSSPFFYVRKGTGFGYWKTDYWHVEPSSPTMRPVLTTGVGDDGLWWKQKGRIFTDIFSYFVSFGITSGGVNSVTMDGERVEARLPQINRDAEPDKGTVTEISATLVISNGLPVGAHVQPKAVGVQAKPMSLAYRYDGNSVPFPIPKEITLVQKVPRPGLPESADPALDGIDRTILQISVVEIKLGKRSSPLPRHNFSPDNLLDGTTNYARLIITNGQSFQLRNKKLYSTAVSAAEEIERLKGPRRSSRSLQLLFLIIIALLPVAMLIRWQRRKRKNLTTESNMKGSPIQVVALYLILGLATFAQSGNSLGQVDPPQCIQVDLEMNSMTYLRRDQNNNWITNLHQWKSSVILGPESWLIESGMPRNSTEYWYSDGTNVYFNVDIHSLPKVSTKLKLSNNIGRSKSVVVIPGDHPLGNIGVNLVWLAYCSGHYLQSSNRLLPVLGTEPRHDIRLFCVEDKTTIVDLPPFLPRKIEFLVQKENAGRAAVSLLAFRSTSPTLPRPILGTNGMLWATYEAEQFTNYLGWTVPLAFKYVQHYRPVNGSDGIYMNAGRVVKVSLATVPESLLENDAPHFVIDTRFRHPDRLVDSLTYTLTNTVVPATNDPVMAEAMQRLAKKRPLAGVQAHTRNPFALLLLILLVSPMVFFGARSYFKTREASKDNDPEQKTNKT